MSLLSFLLLLLLYWIHPATAQLDDLDAEWKSYSNTLKKSYWLLEENIRKELFAATHEMIVEHNKQNTSYTMGHNFFSDLSPREKRQYLGGKGRNRWLFPFSFISNDIAHQQLTASASSLPKTVDYRSNSCLQPVKDQGSCGSCWAFAAVAVVEFSHCQRFKEAVALSEQQLIDCSNSNLPNGNHGCSGGYQETAWTYIALNNGINKASSYPSYQAKENLFCHYLKLMIPTNVGAHVSILSPVKRILPYDINKMTTLLANRQLFSVSFRVVKSFMQYSSGVYNTLDCITNVIGYHATTIVGYGTLNNHHYWIMRNSWGSSWGQGGYILFKKGSNLCGIEAQASYTTASG